MIDRICKALLNVCEGDHVKTRTLLHKNCRIVIVAIVNVVSVANISVASESVCYSRAMSANSVEDGGIIVLGDYVTLDGTGVCIPGGSVAARFANNGDLIWITPTGIDSKNEYYCAYASELVAADDGELYIVGGYTFATAIKKIDNSGNIVANFADVFGFEANSAIGGDLGGVTLGGMFRDEKSNEITAGTVRVDGFGEIVWTYLTPRSNTGNTVLVDTLRGDGSIMTMPTHPELEPSNAFAGTIALNSGGDEAWKSADTAGISISVDRGNGNMWIVDVYNKLYLFREDGKRFDIEAGNVEYYGVQALLHGESIITGVNDSGQLIVDKRSKDGGLIWRSIPISYKDDIVVPMTTARGRVLAVDILRNIYVGAYYKMPNDSNRIALGMLSNDGVVKWYNHVEFKSTNDEHMDFLEAVVGASDGTGVYVIGSTPYSDVPDPTLTAQSRLFVSKVSAEGNEEWTYVADPFKFCDDPFGSFSDDDFGDDDSDDDDDNDDSAQCCGC
ncbi:hypothetical protein K8I61_15805 [bacterium]|nr:hypothetical protein [bacterium]